MKRGIYFDQLCGHPQATCTHKTKITLQIFSVEMRSVCCKFKLVWKYLDAKSYVREASRK